MGRILRCLWAMAALSPFCVPAQDWQLNGVFSQGYVSVDDSPFIVDNKRDSLEITEASLMGSWTPLDKLRLATALNYRQWGSLAEEDLDFDYLFVEYSLPIKQGSVGVRAGRFKNEVGFYSSTRDVAFGRPSIMLPQSIYTDYFRDAQLHIDGVDLFGQHSLASGMLEWHASAGSIDVSDDLSRNVLGTKAFGQFESESFRAMDLDFSTEKLRLGVSYYRAEISFDPKQQLFSGTIGLDNWVLSAQYRYDWLEMTAEYIRGDRSVSGIFLPASLYGIETPFWGYYLDLRAHLSNDVEIFARYDKYIDNADDPHGHQLAQTTAFPAFYAYAKDTALGGRWFFADNWLLALEYHFIEGSSWVPPVSVVDPRQQKHWELFALQLSYRFQW